jgi:hypothetical protein
VEQLVKWMIRILLLQAKLEYTATPSLTAKKQNPPFRSLKQLRATVKLKTVFSYLNSPLLENGLKDDFLEANR